jgi:hypothetical protein
MEKNYNFLYKVFGNKVGEEENSL